MFLRTNFAALSALIGLFVGCAEHIGLPSGFSAADQGFSDTAVVALSDPVTSNQAGMNYAEVTRTESPIDYFRFQSADRLAND